MSNDNKEYLLNENDLLVSSTDLEGNITFADDDFIRISGYAEEELIGNPHNIVRHPDMPKEAFADLWQSITEEKCWSGIIKNRQKNGGYYWVKADVIPLYKEGVHIGFMSVRSAPNKVDLERVKNLYLKFKSGDQGKLIFKNGRIIKKAAPTFASLFTIKQRLLGLVIFATISILAVLGMGVYSTYTEKESVQHIYHANIKVYGQLKEISSLWQENRYLLNTPLLTDNYQENLNVSQKLKQNSLGLELLISQLMNTNQQYVDAAGVELYERVAAENNLLATTSIQPIYNNLISNNQTSMEREQLTALIENTITEIETYRAEIQTHINSIEEETEAIYQFSLEAFLNEVIISVALTIMCVITLLIITFFFNRDIQFRLQAIKHYFNKLVIQDYLFEVKVDNHDEVDQVLQSLKIMKVQLAFNMEKMKQKAITATRIKIALDNVSTNVLIADNDRNIIYANPAVIKMFKNSEQQLKAVLPNFNADHIVGSNIDQFHEKPSHQAQLLQTFTSEHRAQVEVNGCIFQIITNPVIDDEEQRIGSVAEWSDRTLEIAIERDIESVIQAAVKGDFTQRMDLDGKNAFFTTLCESINRLLEISEVSLADIVRVLSSLAQGDLTAKIEADYSGAFGELKESSNLTVSKLKEMILQIKISADTINTAAKEFASGNVDLSQRTEKQASSLEVTASSMEELTVTVKQNSEHAKQANHLAKETSTNALEGGDIVKKVVDNMSEINTSSQKIMNIISVIDSIAFQTNILALNAAVEAARAGEQGRGFAVVATEVRNLAQRSATAAKEVKALISSSVQKIETGTTLADQAGKSITDVVISIQEVAKLIEGITIASVEQSVGIDQVSRAILQIDDVTQQNSALVEEGSAAASSLEEQVANLAIYVAAFDTGEGAFHHEMKRVSSTKHKHSPHLGDIDDDNDWSEF
ncbi:hypothetical protein GCM10007916_34870 [Psychromonas marina]|uniref:PAS domain S-box protein n=1 Tax=Psychromonas marina TaxID=88364 RepID=A0ABQ6E5X5_9GAMM|nr:methyl-accepting chemotaxis protein [Psychromonas marina]GLS92416.1 hypothetical protein GCM10007916_34870 [Psychromonas marina]